MVAQLVPERQFRGPGCTDACEVVRAIVPGRFGRSELLLHDPSAHEAYGRGMAVESAGSVVTVGALSIDRARRLVESGGRVVALTDREWELLEYLAARADRAVSRREISLAIWGEWAHPCSLSTLLDRLRRRLGPCGGLIESHGYGWLRLTDEPPPERYAALRASSWAWSKRAAFCGCCGRVDRPHYGHGRCTCCRARPAREWQHYGPCGAPPPAEMDGAP